MFDKRRNSDPWPGFGRPGLVFHNTLKIERVRHRVYAARNAARRDAFAGIGGVCKSRRVRSVT